MIDTRATALDKDQSSLTALNIRGLLSLDSAYALAMAATAITIFVFGLCCSGDGNTYCYARKACESESFGRSWSPSQSEWWSPEQVSGRSWG